MTQIKDSNMEQVLTSETALDNQPVMPTNKVGGARDFNPFPTTSISYN